MNGKQAAHALTLETLDELIKAAGYHREPVLRVTPEFYSEVKCMPSTAGPGLPVGRVVLLVDDGSENVKLIDGKWTFVPTEKPNPFRTLKVI